MKRALSQVDYRIGDQHNALFNRLRQRKVTADQFFNVYLKVVKDDKVMVEFERCLDNVFPDLKEEVMGTYAAVVIEKGLQRGQQLIRWEEALSYTLRLLKRRFGILSARVEAKIRRLTVEQLEQLGEDSLDFQKLSDLSAWLRTHQPGN